ncbi:MAG: hypothetical protein AAGC95_02175 [Pseudomonadota bacterium]
MPTQHSIRPASTDDYPAIAAIAESTELFPASALNDMISGYRENTSKDIWFVAERDGAVASFGFCDEKSAIYFSRAAPHLIQLKHVAHGVKQP